MNKKDKEEYDDISTPFAYTKENVAYCKKEINHFSANMGGTEIDKPLKAVMSNDSHFFKDTDTKYTKKIFVLTDGIVANSLTVIETI